ncbi:MAG: MAE_28990/MAE_18760 family HEPN-like nuclease [Desulfobulbaceae bacterium]|nr:MAE_28990/MAE_18760 family HEPN-like nuclease [Desulfobulbaceae bacterium]
MRNWQSEIEDDLKWRENELLFLKKIAFDTREDEIKNVTALRSLWVMLYAHYEGFCMFVWDIYLDHIEHSHVQNKNLSSSIMMISLSKDLTKLRKNITNKLLCNFCDVEYPKYLEQYASFPDENKLSTKSNLYPNVMDDNNDKLSISLPSLGKGNNRTNIKALVSRRNDIAHGKKMYIRNLEEYKIYEESAFDIMIDLACEIIEAIEKKVHLKI